MNSRNTFIIPIIALAFIGIVYLTTLLALFPNLPVITFRAEDMSNYVEIYPPFRMDEINYYTITKNILNGEVYREGSIERSFSAGYPLIAAPLVAIFDELGIYLTNTLIVWLTVIIFYILIRRYLTMLMAVGMTLVFAFTTLNWFYAASCYTEPLAQLLILSGFFLLTMKKTGRKRPLILMLAGVMIGLNLFVRVHYILLMIPLFLLLSIRRVRPFKFDKGGAWFAGGIVITIALWMIRNTVYFGSPLTFEYSRMVGQLTGSKTSLYYSGHFFWGMHELLFDKYHGLLTITPIFLLFPAGINKMRKAGHRFESNMILASVALIVLFIASTPYPFTQFGLGSRHMVPIMPLLFLPTVFLFDRTRFTRIIFILLAAYSFYHAGVGWFTSAEDYVSEKGFFAGLLHQQTSRAIILNRKSALPERTFESKQEILEAFDNALLTSNYILLFQTLDPKVRANIQGNERSFVTYLRAHQDVLSLIESVDIKSGILLQEFKFIQ